MERLLWYLCMMVGGGSMVVGFWLLGRYVT